MQAERSSKYTLPSAWVTHEAPEGQWLLSINAKQNCNVVWQSPGCSQGTAVFLPPRAARSPVNKQREYDFFDVFHIKKSRVALVLFKRLTDRLSNHSGTNISIPHNPVGLPAKSALYTGKNSNDTLGELTLCLTSSYQVLKEWHRDTGIWERAEM